MRLAVTGHRPDKLGGYGREAWNRLVEVAKGEIERLKPELVITGMALGWDQAIARACVSLEIPFDAYIPFAGQATVWPQEAQDLYYALLRNARNKQVICPGKYAHWMMQARNVAMVDNCDQLLALWNGTKGGTENCVKYANKMGIPVINCWYSFSPADDPTNKRHSKRIVGEHFVPSSNQEVPFNAD